MLKAYRSIAVMLIMALSLCSAGLVRAEEETAVEAASGETTALEAENVEPPTREEILEHLNTVFKYRLNIRQVFPDITVEGEEDSFICSYKGSPLEELDEDTLMGLFRAVNQQISIKNLENMQALQRQQRQQQSLKQIENINRTQRSLRQQRSISTQTPKVYTPTKIPKPYKPPKRY
jgi:hypothetical protein